MLQLVPASSGHHVDGPKVMHMHDHIHGYGHHIAIMAGAPVLQCWFECNLYVAGTRLANPEQSPHSECLPGHSVCRTNVCSNMLHVAELRVAETWLGLPAR